MKPEEILLALQAMQTNFPSRAQVRRTSRRPGNVGKHCASKKGADHKTNSKKRPVFSKLTNNQRVIADRAAKMGITVTQYQVKFPKL